MEILDKYSENADALIRDEPYTGSDIELADVDEYVITDSESDLSYVGTNGLASCVGVTLHEPDKEIGAVSHSIPDAENPILEGDNLVEEMLSDLEDRYNLDPIAAKIVTGGNPLPDKLKQVNYSLKQSDFVKEEIEWIKMSDEAGKPAAGSVALNTKNGNIKPLPYSEITFV